MIRTNKQEYFFWRNRLSEINEIVKIWDEFFYTQEMNTDTRDIEENAHNSIKSFLLWESRVFEQLKPIVATMTLQGHTQSFRITDMMQYFIGTPSQLDIFGMDQHDFLNLLTKAQSNTRVIKEEKEEIYKTFPGKVGDFLLFPLRVVDKMGFIEEKQVLRNKPKVISSIISLATAIITGGLGGMLTLYLVKFI